MITGWFQDGAGTVKAMVWCPVFNVRMDVDFRIDTLGETSVVSARDLALNAAHLPLDDAVPYPIRGGHTLAYAVPSILTFAKDDGTVTTAQLYLHIVDDAPGESRLGRDVLNEWLMVYDAPGGNLLFETVEA